MSNRIMKVLVLALGATAESETAQSFGVQWEQSCGGDGFSTMANGTQTFMFSFGPLSGLADIAAGKPGTEFPSTFNTTYVGTLLPGDPASTDNAYNGSATINYANFGYN